MAPAEYKTETLAKTPALGFLPRMVLPDLAAMLAVATLAYCLFVFGAGTGLFRDSDTGWHIRTGERILSTHTLPRTDPYSFSKSGEPWLAWEWGADLLMGAAHRMDGLRGVMTVFALAIAASAWMCCRLHFAAGGDFSLTALLMPLIVTTASLHWLARPHILSWLFLLATLLYAERPAAQFGPRQFAAVAAGSALWANVHGSFLMAPLIAFVYAGGYLLRPLLWPLDRRAEWVKAYGFLSAAFAALAGSFLNPYGWKLHAHILSYLTDEELTARIAEFQAFNFHAKDAWQVALVVLVAMAGAVLALTQRKLAQFVIMALLVGGGLRSARALPLVALLALPLANGAFTEALRRTRTLQPGLTQFLDRAIGYSARLRWFDRRLNGAAFGTLCVAALLVGVHAPAYSRTIGFPTARFPVQASAAVERLPAGARLLSNDSFGGYLIYRFSGARLVFFDGRSDFYGANFMKQYLTLLEARPGWQRIADSFRFTHALLPPDAALTAALQQAGWSPIYRDNVAVLLEAR